MTEPSYRTLLRHSLSTLFAVLILLGMGLGTIGNLSHKSYIAALTAAGGVLICVFLATKRERWRDFISRLDGIIPRKAAALLTVMCLLIHGGSVVLFHPVQAPDYQTFFQAAVDLSNGIHPQNRAYIAMFPHILGYASFLSIFLKVFGQNIVVAGLLNTVLTALSGLFLFQLCLKKSGTIAACFAYGLWITCPSKFLYNSMSLSEPYYTCLLLLFFTVIMKQSVRKAPADKPAVCNAAVGAAAGLILQLVNTARPIGVIPIIALLLWLMLLTEASEIRNNRRAWLLFVICMLLTYWAGGRAWRAYATAVLEQPPASVPGYSLYVGLNQDTQGSYADEDMDLLQSRYFGEYKENADEAQKSMLSDAGMRLHAERDNLIPLLLNKLGTLLGHDEGGAFYARESLSDYGYTFWCIVSNMWYYAVCIAAVGGCVRLLRADESGMALVVILFSIGLILAQLLVEVAARYHYALIPCLIFTACWMQPRCVKSPE